MSRDFTPSEREDSREPSSAPQGHTPRSERSHPSQDQAPTPNSYLERDSELPRDSRSIEPPSPDSGRVIYDRDRTYSLRESEIHTLIDLGRFRVIATEDLAKHAYRDAREEAQQDIHNLTRQGLVRLGTFEGPDASSRELLTLTKSGHRLVRANRLVPKDQATYHGFVKPKEANHDADIYRLYQKEAERILDKGGRNLRVILDFELKKKLNRDFAKFGAESRPEIAARHGLQVVGNKIPVPDLRIEYETREGNLGRVDLELATEHYRPRQLAEKAQAGFSFYASRTEADRLRRVFDQRELTAEILTL